MKAPMTRSHEVPWMPSMMRRMGIPRYHAAAIQVDHPNPRRRDEIARNVDRMLELAQMAVEGYRPFFPVKLLVFPEFALAAPLYATAEELLEKLAMPVP